VFTSSEYRCDFKVVPLLVGYTADGRMVRHGDTGAVTYCINRCYLALIKDRNGRTDTADLKANGDAIVANAKKRAADSSGGGSSSGVRRSTRPRTNKQPNYRAPDEFDDDDDDFV
jgi:hypothetical protein